MQTSEGGAIEVERKARGVSEEQASQCNWDRSEEGEGGRRRLGCPTGLLSGGGALLEMGALGRCAERSGLHLFGGGWPWLLVIGSVRLVQRLSAQSGHQHESSAGSLSQASCLATQDSRVNGNTGVCAGTH